MKNDLEIILKVSERDTDFAIVRAFIKSKNVRELFFSKIHKQGKLIKVYHSYTQDDFEGHVGESDIIFIFKDKFDKKFAIFIEDKVAADPQPSQRERYSIRARALGQEEGFGDDYYVFLCAPNSYLKTDKAKAYKQNTVSHEDIMMFVDNELDKKVFKESCNPDIQKHASINDDPTLDFWKKLEKYIKENSNILKIRKQKDIKGRDSKWVTFPITAVKGLSLIWKSDQNVIDLEFSGMANKKDEVIKMLPKIDGERMFLEKTSGSLALRKYLGEENHVFFNKPFEEQIAKIDVCIKEAEELRVIANYVALSTTQEKEI